MTVRIGVAAMAVMLLAGAAMGVNIETVTVRDAGNADDTHGDGHGGVDHIYSIGKFEVTAGQYADFLNAVAEADPYKLYNTEMWSSSYGCKIERTGEAGSYTYSVGADRADRPVNYVSWGDAARFCNWLENGQPTGAQGLLTTEDGSYYLNGATSLYDLAVVTREVDAVWVIPSEDEWYKAAYYDADGTAYYDYPTGTDATPSNALIDPDPGNNANFYDPNLSGIDAYAIGPPYYRTEVGEFENSEGPWGTYDQGGNVWEWTEEIVTGYERGNRGGSYGDLASVEDLRADHRRSNLSSAQSHGIGFRLVNIPEPTSLLLLALAGLGALPRRRRA